MTNLEKWVRNAPPVVLYMTVQEIACKDCMICPAKSDCKVKKTFEGGDPLPLQCSNAFKKWALKEIEK